MANWAIVIGVDQYWNPGACLRGAVRDALRMRAWLLSGDGGGVPAENLTLLLSPAADSPEVDITGVIPATRDNIVLALDDLLQASSGQGERFFFYFAGHGATARIDFSNQDSIVPADFTPRLTSKAIPLRSIFEYLQASQFGEQFFFVDACRNIPWEGEEREFRVGPLDVPRRPQPPVPPQFIMYATAPLLRAVELRQPGDERGVFTEALLAGLRGGGQAKVWDDMAQAYVLRWDRLFQYVDSQVRDLLARQRSLDGEGAPDSTPEADDGARDARPSGAPGRQRAGSWPQQPRQAGERGSENPVLARFAAGAFSGEALEVDLEPEEAAEEVEIVVGDLSGEVDRRSGIGELPVRFLLPPKTYSVRARARTYRPQMPYYPVDLYGPQALQVRLVSSPEVAFSLESLRPAPAPKGRAGEAGPGIIHLSAPDPLARIELADNAGWRLAVGEGSLRLDGRPPGFYRARLVTPEGRYAEKLIELLPGEEESVRLEAPPPPASPLFRQVAARAGLVVAGDNTLRGRYAAPFMGLWEPAEGSEPLAAARLSTLLALAGGAANGSQVDGAPRWGDVGFSAFTDLVGGEAGSGLQILFGIEAAGEREAEAYLARLRLRCWTQGQAPPADAASPIPVPDLPGLAQFAWPLSPGACWLSIETPEQRPVAFATAVLPGRPTLVVFTRSPEGEVSLHQYLSLAPYTMLRRSELIQRACTAGSLEASSQNVLDLLQGNWFEPLAACLAGRAALAADPANQPLGAAVERLIHDFGGLADGHVLHAARLEAQGGREPAAAYRTALALGLPLLAESLVQLQEGMARHGIEHERAAVLHTVHEQRVRGLLWTAVPVEDLA